VHCNTRQSTVSHTATDYKEEKDHNLCRAQSPEYEQSPTKETSTHEKSSTKDTSSIPHSPTHTTSPLGHTDTPTHTSPHDDRPTSTTTHVDTHTTPRAEEDETLQNVCTPSSTTPAPAPQAEAGIYRFFRFLRRAPLSDDCVQCDDLVKPNDLAQKETSVETQKATGANADMFVVVASETIHELN